MTTNNKQKPQLGRGLGALLGSTSIAASSQVATDANTKTGNSMTGPMLVDISMIKPNKEQPRKIFNDKELMELSNSIKENGIIQPLVVSQIENNQFEIIAGERRYRASKLAGLKKLPVVIKKVTKRDTLVMAIIENVQREDLNCVEEGLAYYQLMNEFNLTQEEVAKKIGKERSTIANYLRILKLPREVIANVQKDLISFGHAKVLVSLKDDEKIKYFANRIILENLSVRELEAQIKKRAKTSKPASNKFFDEKLDQIKLKLEKTTGFHFELSNKNNGSGEIKIKYSNEAEFNDIFEYLTRK